VIRIRRNWKRFGSLKQQEPPGGTQFVARRYIKIVASVCDALERLENGEWVV